MVKSSHLYLCIVCRKTFSDFTISPWIVMRLNELGFGTAFEVQAKTLPLSLDGR